jgi:hypothetical protein
MTSSPSRPRLPPPARACTRISGGSDQGDATGSEIGRSSGSGAVRPPPAADGTARPPPASSTCVGRAAWGAGVVSAVRGVEAELLGAAALPQPVQRATVAAVSRTGVRSRESGRTPPPSARASPDLTAEGVPVSRGSGYDSEGAWRRAPFGGVVQSVRTPACHAGGRGFESRRSRPIQGILDGRHRGSSASFHSASTRAAAGSGFCVIVRASRASITGPVISGRGGRRGSG